MELFAEQELDILCVQETWLDTTFEVPKELRNRIRVLHS